MTSPATNAAASRPSVRAAPGPTNPGPEVRATRTEETTNPPPEPGWRDLRDDGPGPARPVRSVFEAQIALARQGISAGSLDARLGSQTRAALSAYQRRIGLVPTGVLDRDTRERLLITPPLLATFEVGSNDLARLRPVPKTWLEKSQQTRLDYESLLELVAEKSQSHPALIRRLNPGVDWSNPAPALVLRVPRVEYPPPSTKAGLIRISLSERHLEVLDTAGHLLAFFPCSIGRVAAKRPVGDLQVVVVAPNPNYTFDPEVFPESEEGRRLGRKLVLPPGPNNPVGTAWIGLSRPGYGIHGTPNPEQVGRTESHGCFRLANWNAEYLARLVSVGTPVRVEP